MMGQMSLSAPQSKQPSVCVSRVPVEAIIDLRHEVLRQGLPREAALFDGDNDPSACHWGAFAGDRLIGCVTLHPSHWENHPAWQLRGMAVADGHRKFGVGRELLRAVNEHVSQEKTRQVLWCNARVPAAAFYQKFGWQIMSDIFEIPTAGPHVRMLKRPAE
jgi:predicted GNAT family N-acyltransferase